MPFGHLNVCVFLLLFNMPPATKKPTPAIKSTAPKPPAKLSTGAAAGQSKTRTPVPASVKRKKKDDLGAGLRISKDNVDAHPAGPPRYGELTQAERAFTLASTFLSGVLAYAYLAIALGAQSN